MPNQSPPTEPASDDVLPDTPPLAPADPAPIDPAIAGTMPNPDMDPGRPSRPAPPDAS